MHDENYDDYIYIKSLSGQQDCYAKLFTYTYVLHLETYYFFYWLITSPQWKKIESTRLLVDKASTYLGVTSQVNRKYLKQQEALKKSAKAECKKLVTCHFTHYVAHMCQACSINPTLSYPFDT